MSGNKQKSKKLLEQNKDKNFVQRMFDSNPAIFKNTDGSTSTHKMEWATDDKGAFVYPTVVQFPGIGSLAQLTPMGAINYAQRSGEFIRTTPEFADYFSSQGYKDASGMNNKKYKKGGKIPQAAFGATMANVGKQAGQMLSSAIPMGLQALNYLIPEDNTRPQIIEPQAVPFTPTGSQMIFDDGGRVNKRWRSKKTGMTAEYFDPGEPTPRFQQTVPPPFLGDPMYAPQQKFVSYEMLSDKMGREKSSPVFFGYSDREIESIIPQLGYDVNNYNDWRELWSGVDAKRTRSNSNPVQPLSFNPYTGNTIQFNGPDHSQGGIDISYQGQPAEVEGGETAFKSQDGSLNIFGNMTLPGSTKKFKQAGKEIAKKENKVTNVTTKAKKLMDSNDPLKQQTGALMFKSADNQLKSLAEEKENLANIQNQMLFEAEQSGMDPKTYSNQFKKGGKIYASGGTMASEFHKTIGEGMGMDYSMPGIDPGMFSNPANINVPNFTPQPSSTTVAKPVMQPVKEAPKDFVEAFKIGINAVELSGNRKAYGKKHGTASSAFGPFGFLDSSGAALQEVYKKHYRDTFPSRSALAKAMMQDGKLHEEVMTQHTLDLLSKYNGNPNAAALEHFAGPKAAKSYLMGKLNLNEKPTANNLTYKQYLSKFRKTGFGDMNFENGGNIPSLDDGGLVSDQYPIVPGGMMQLQPAGVSNTTNNTSKAVYTGTFKEAFKQARKDLGAGQVFEWNGKTYSTALSAETGDKNLSDSVKRVNHKRQYVPDGNAILPFETRPEFITSQQNYEPSAHFDITKNRQIYSDIPGRYTPLMSEDEKIYFQANGYLPQRPSDRTGSIKKYNKNQSVSVPEGKFAEKFLGINANNAVANEHWNENVLTPAMNAQAAITGAAGITKGILTMPLSTKYYPFGLKAISSPKAAFPNVVKELPAATPRGWSINGYVSPGYPMYKEGGKIPKAFYGDNIPGEEEASPSNPWAMTGQQSFTLPSAGMTNSNTMQPVTPIGLSRTVPRPELKQLPADAQQRLQNDQKAAEAGVQKKKGSLADKNKLSPLDFMGEAAALLQRPQKVGAFQYQPQFFQNYQVSMDAQRNDLNSAMRGMEKQFVNNPAAMAQLYANKLDAMGQINNQEFQTNNQLRADIYNRNTGMANEAALQNIGFQAQAQQMNLQSEANTRRQQMNALGSIGNKINFNKAENSKIRMSEDMTGFMYMPGGNGQQGQWVRTGDAYKIKGTVGTQNFNNTTKDDQKKIDEIYDFITQKKTIKEYGGKMLNFKYGGAFRYGGKTKGGKVC